MVSLSTLKNTTKESKRRKRIGRGIGSGFGKTCGRGTKGQGARSGYKRRAGYEGGQFRLFMKLPTRGFSNARFSTGNVTVNLKDIERIFNDGETVNLETLKQNGFISNIKLPLKVLGEGELTKKVTIEAHAFSQSALKKLKAAKVDFKVL